MKKVRLCAGVLAVMCVLPTATAQSATETWAQASSGVRNLTYELVDLQPDDALAPGIQFVSSFTEPQALRVSNLVAHGILSLRPEALIGNAAYEVYEGFLPAEGLQVTSLDGLATVFANASSVGSSVKLTPAELGTLIPLPGTSDSKYISVLAEHSGFTSLPAHGYYDVDFDFQVSPEVRVGANPGGDLGPFDFILAPHTALTLRGETFASIQLDLDALPSSMREESDDLSVSSATDVAVMFQAPDFSLEGVYPSYDALMTSYEAAYRIKRSGSLVDNGLNPDLSPTDSDVATGKPFELTLVNDSDEARAGLLFVSSTSQIFLRDTTVVPEPSTWALMALGLVGVVFAANRRRC